MTRLARAYTGDQPYVFVCYSHADTAVVYPEIEMLQTHGINVWYDEGVAPGEEWTDELGQAIAGAVRFVYFVTPASVASKHCRNEVHFAQKHDKPMLAIHLAPTELPAGLELSIGSHQAILKYQTEADAYREKVLSAVGERASGKATKAKSTTAATTGRRGRRWTALVTATIVVAAGAWLWRAELTGQPVRAIDRSVAVLSAQTAGLDKPSSAYVDALAEELRGLLASYAELRVVSQGETGRADGASYHVLLKGTGDDRQLRLRTQLARTDDGVVVWSQGSDLQGDDPRAPPPLLASDLGRMIRLQLVQDQQCESVRRKTRNRQAADFVCAALADNYRVNQGGDPDFQLQLSNAQRAVELAPDLAEAHFYLSGAYASLGAWESARAALNRALALEPDDPLLSFAQANLALQADWNLPGARRGAERAIALDPLHPNARWFHGLLGLTALREGNVDESLEHYGRAVRVYDADARIWQEYAGALYLADEYNRAIRAADASLRLLVPSAGFNRILTLFWKASAQVALGHVSAGNATIDEIASLRVPFGGLVRLLARVGRTDEARELLAELERQSGQPTGDLAIAYLPFDVDRAFEWLAKGIDERTIGYSVNFLRISSVWAPYHTDPRWIELMQKLSRIESGVAAKVP